MSTWADQSQRAAFDEKQFDPSKEDGLEAFAGELEASQRR